LAKWAALKTDWPLEWLNEQSRDMNEDRINQIVFSSSPQVKDPRHIRVDEDGSLYSPNHIPRGERIKNVLLSSVLLAYGTFGIWIDDLYLPGKRGPGVHLHGVPAKVMYVAMLFACANLLTVVVDHYDQRNNEHRYRRIAKLTQVAGWVTFGLALVLDLFVFRSHT
jgi:hypothetical protein